MYSLYSSRFSVSTAGLYLRTNTVERPTSPIDGSMSIVRGT